MPINNITQTISELPAAGRRGVDVQTLFVIKQEDFQDHLQGTTVTELNTLKDQLNARIGEINSTATTMNGYVNDAFMGSSTATTKAGEAATSATAALTSRNQASSFATNSSNSATKASQWADNNYNVAVEAGKYSAKHWATEAQNVVLNKVTKVTSTDNAIVRFNGTTGDVQNSGVIIDDNGNVGIGTANPSTKLAISNGSDENIEFITGMASTFNGGVIQYINRGNGYTRPDLNYYLATGGGSHKFFTNSTEIMRIDSAGNVLVIGTGGLGYGTGSGGTVTQLTSKSTSVTLNKPSGRITMHNGALAAGASVSFDINNSLFSEGIDHVILTPLYQYVDPNNYRIECIGNGGANLIRIRVTNIHNVSLSESLVFRFCIIKGAVS